MRVPQLLICFAVCLFSIISIKAQLRFTVGPSFNYLNESGIGDFSGSSSLQLGYNASMIYPWGNSILGQLGVSYIPNSEIGIIHMDTRFRMKGSKVNIDPLIGISIVLQEGAFGTLALGSGINLGGFMTLSVVDKVNVFVEPKVNIGTLGFAFCLGTGVLF